ncbi:hypothetical protein GYA25_01025 [Candidatus Woesearchaeota archaeon]|nr:hypothetical protein [Candidatus Woesearchaeota archaeon]
MEDKIEIEKFSDNTYSVRFYSIYNNFRKPKDKDKITSFVDLTFELASQYKFFLDSSMPVYFDCKNLSVLEEKALLEIVKNYNNAAGEIRASSLFDDS